MMFTQKLWGRHNGKDIFLVTLSNDKIQVGVSNLGCTFTSITVGRDQNIVLGYDSLDEYLEDPYYIGCIVGRFAGRIRDSRFEINGTRHQLSINEKGTGHHLHGGFSGFNKKIFRIADSGYSNDNCFVRFETISPHHEEGYPGTLQISVLIELNSNNEINTVYEARTDRATHVNLTHHHYFNLKQLTIYADEYLGQDQNYIPDGSVRKVKNTLNDFTAPRVLADVVKEKVFNEYFVLNRANASGTDATLGDPSTGLQVDIATTYPCIVFYAGDFLSDPFQKNEGICLETQFFPDTPNQHFLPSTLLMPGNIYFHETKMKILI